MKILYLVPYAPTLIRTRPYNLIRALARNGQQVDLYTLWENDGERETLTNLQEENITVKSYPLRRTRIFMNVLHGVFSRNPLQAWYSWEPKMLSDLLQSLEDEHVDIILIEHLRGALYLKRLSESVLVQSGNIPLVWDAVDCITFLFEQASRQSRSSFSRWTARLELPRTRRLEAELPCLVRRLLVTSRNDRDAFLNILRVENSEGKVKVLHNGVDLSYFYPTESPRSDNTLVFSGKLSYHANISAARYLLEEIMPRVWARRPRTRLKLVGKNPHPFLTQYGKREPRVEVTGGVPDIRPYLRSSQLAVAPIIYGTGIQNKVLEAMACGTPVVATPQAISALENVKAGRDILLAQNSEELSNVIINVMDDYSLQRSLSEAGLAYIRRWHDWNRIAEKLVVDFQSLQNHT